MKVKLLTNGGYTRLITKIGEVVNADFNGDGYYCEVLALNGRGQEIYTTLYFDALEVEEIKTDPIVESVLTIFRERSAKGIATYGTTLQENNLSVLEWLNHLQEEMMDATLYIQRLKDEVVELEKLKQQRDEQSR